MRSTDGSGVEGTYTFGSGPGEYQPTPPSFGSPSIPAWRFVTPFVLKRGDQFRADGPPSLSSGQWAEDFDALSAARLESRFDLAYNGAHALSLAALRRLGYRSENRYVSADSRH